MTEHTVIQGPSHIIIFTMKIKKKSRSYKQVFNEGTKVTNHQYRTYYSLCHNIIGPSRCIFIQSSSFSAPASISALAIASWSSHAAHACGDIFIYCFNIEYLVIRLQEPPE
jgi:hypothetical protein